MITEKDIEIHAGEWLQNNNKFLVAVKIKPGNRIMVFIDGDKGVSIDDCVKLSRHIESNIDRNVEDFELQVSSSGADQPLLLQRQYPQHLGRILMVTKTDETVIKGKFEEYSDKGITVKIAADKKKKQAEENVFIAFSEITKSKIELSFKK